MQRRLPLDKRAVIKDIVKRNGRAACTVARTLHVARRVTPYVIVDLDAVILVHTRGARPRPCSMRPVVVAGGRWVGRLAAASPPLCSRAEATEQAANARTQEADHETHTNANQPPDAKYLD